MEFTDVKEERWAQFDTFKLIAAQSIDVLENLKSRITQLETGGSIVEEAEPLNVIDALIVDTSPPYNSSRSVVNLFDNYLNPYDGGFQGGFLWNTRVNPAFVVIDTRTSIRVGSVTFYSFGNAQRWCPKKFDVFSGTSGTGPWTLRGTANWEGAYPPTANASQTVLFANIKTAQF